MTRYICPRCLFETPKKTNFQRHINRKRMCKNKKFNINPKEYEEILFNDNIFMEYFSLLEKFKNLTSNEDEELINILQAENDILKKHIEQLNEQINLLKEKNKLLKKLKNTNRIINRNITISVSLDDYNNLGLNYIVDEVLKSIPPED